LSLRKRVFSFTLTPEMSGELDSFLERLLSRLPAQVSKISIEGGKIRVEVIAPASQMKDVLLAIKRVLSEFSGVGSLGPGRLRIPISHLSTSGGPVVSSELLCFVLGEGELCYCKVSGDGAYLETDCPEDVLHLYVARLGKALDALSRLPHLSRGVRRVLAAVMVLGGYDVYEALELLEDAGLIVWEGGRFTLMKPWRETVYNVLKSGSARDGA